VKRLIDLSRDGAAVRTAGSIALLATVNAILGAVTQWYVLLTLGAGPATDALFATTTIPVLLVSLFANTIFVVGVPVVSVLRERAERLEAGWALTWLVGGGFGGLALILGSSSRFWLPLVLPGFSRDTLELAHSMLTIQLGSMVPFACTVALWTTYHAERRFLTVELLTLGGGLASLMLLVLLLPRLGAIAGAWANLVRFTLQALALALGLRPICPPSLRLPALRTTLARVRPLLLGTGILQLGQLLDRSLASLARPGDLSLLHTALMLHQGAGGVLSKAIAQPAAPGLAQAHAQGDLPRFRKLVRRRAVALTLVIAMGAVAGLLLGLPLLGLLFPRLDEEQIRLLWVLCLTLVGFAIGGPMGQLFGAGFLARGDTRTPTVIALSTHSLGLGLKALGYFMAGVAGMAAATSITYGAALVALLVLLRRTWRSTGSQA
jgi:peptidoglycan biosynthesis protein MviN/MurJ (putative lipid II flippase)